jgi:outer membrane protein OmpA-like peptidoglycan-associated protein
LSERRARAVADDLVAQGVQPVRLATRGFGETQPIASNDTAEGRTQNRRVEIKIAPAVDGG